MIMVLMKTKVMVMIMVIMMMMASPQEWSSTVEFQREPSSEVHILA